MNAPFLLTANKEYICQLCGEKIPQGTKYWFKRTSPFGGSKEHSNCANYEISIINQFTPEYKEDL